VDLACRFSGGNQFLTRQRSFFFHHRITLVSQLYSHGHALVDGACTLVRDMSG
jgi:hypothetical protein